MISIYRGIVGAFSWSRLGTRFKFVDGSCSRCGTNNRYKSGGCKACMKAYRLANPLIYAGIAFRQSQKEKVIPSGTCVRCGVDDRYTYGGCRPCAKARALLNPEERSAYLKAWRASNREKCREYSRVKYLKYPERCRQSVKKAHLKNYENKLLHSAKQTSRDNGGTIDINVSDIVIPSVCPLLGIRLDRSATALSDNLPYIDRIDPSKGYVKGNVWVTSWRANKLKSDGTSEEWTGIWKGVARAMRHKPVPTCNQHAPERVSRARQLVQGARDTSRMYGWTTDLKFSDIIIPAYCPLLGIWLDCKASSRAPNLPSLDRIASAKRYTKNNIWVVSWRANRLKGDATLAELRGIALGLQRVTRLQERAA